MLDPEAWVAICAAGVCAKGGGRHEVAVWGQEEGQMAGPPTVVSPSCLLPLNYAARWTESN